MIMIWFDQRRRLAMLFKKWLMSNRADLVFESFIDYLLDNNLLKEDAVLEFLKKEGQQ